MEDFGVRGPRQRTLPREMFTSAKEFLTPTIAAAATLMIGASIVFLAVFLVLRSRGGAAAFADLKLINKSTSGFEIECEAEELDWTSLPRRAM
jgi:hypothetical protein